MGRGDTRQAQARELPRRRRDPRQGRLARCAGSSSGSANLSLRVWGSFRTSSSTRSGLSLRSGFGDEYLRVGYLKCFMDGTLGSQTALMTDGTGVEITSRAELEEVVRRAAELAGR